MYSNTTGDSNTAVGNQALYLNTTGTLNTAVGSNALDKSTTGNRNTCIGYNAGTEITTGSDIDAFGAYTLQSTLLVLEMLLLEEVLYKIIQRLMIMLL